MRLAEGRRPKGRGGAWRRSLPSSSNRIVERSSHTTFRPTRCRALSGGGTPSGKPAAVRGRAGRRSSTACAGRGGFGIIRCVDAGREIASASAKSQVKRGRNPACSGVGTPFNRNTTTISLYSRSTQQRRHRVIMPFTGRICPVYLCWACGRASCKCIGSNRYAPLSCMELLRRR